MQVNVMVQQYILTLTSLVSLQVAQLWQRDRASSINFTDGGVNLRLLWIEELLFAPLRHDAIYGYASYGKQTISSTRPSYWIQISTLETISRWLIVKKRKNRSLSHPLGHLGVTYALRLWLVGKRMVDFIFVVIELFSLSPTVETLWAEIGRSLRFSKRVGHFERRFQREGGVADQPLLVLE